LGFAEQGRAGHPHSGLYLVAVIEAGSQRVGDLLGGDVFSGTVIVDMVLL
jgi:hypothetical protein